MKTLLEPPLYNPHYQPPAPTTLEGRIRLFSRDRIVYLLEEIGGIQCYETEDISVLQEALKVNIEDGTIPESALELE